jgi:hypothetical protein
MSALRHAVLTALGAARERVARGSPSLHAAIYYLRLADKAWAEVDRAIDDVRFEPGPEPLDVAAPRRRGEEPAVTELREALEAARHNTWLPWEDPGGLTRAQCVGLLTRAMERVKQLPTTAVGPLFPSLPF